MNVKLAVVLALACLSFIGVCFAHNDNNDVTNNDYDQDDRIWQNNQVTLSFGSYGAKIRVHSMYDTSKWIQVSHLQVTETTAQKALVYLKNTKGKVTKNVRGVDLRSTQFKWDVPKVVLGPQGRTVDTFIRASFQVYEKAPITNVIFHVHVAQDNSTMVVNGVTLRREVDDVQFTLEVDGWPFETTSNMLNWQMYVRTNYRRSNDPLYDGILVHRVAGRPGRNSYIFKNAIIDFPDQAAIDGANKPVIHEISNLAANGDYQLDVYFPRAAKTIFYDAILKLLPPPPPPPPSACAPNPCLNGGTCTNVPGSGGAAPTASCACTPAYTGTTCQTGAVVAPPDAPPPPPPPPAPTEFILGQPISGATPIIDYGFDNGNLPIGGSTAFGQFHSADSTFVMYPAGAGMRLYGSASPNYETDDFVQLTQSVLQELDSTGAEVAGHIFNISGDGATWDVEPAESPNYIKFHYHRAGLAADGVTNIQFDLFVKYYMSASVAALTADGESVAIGAGALKFTVQVSPWPFQNLDGTSQLKWTAFLQTRYDTTSPPANVAVGAQQRFAVSAGNYDVLGQACVADGASCVVYISYAFINNLHNIVHVMPFYTSQLQFDPILSLKDPNDHTVYPPWVAPNAPGSASVIRDPHSQFAAASTTQASALIVTVLAAAAALLM